MQEVMLVSIRDYRKNKLGITQQQASEKLGITRGKLSQWENNPETMTFSDYQAISKKYGFVCPHFF